MRVASRNEFAKGLSLAWLAKGWAVYACMALARRYLSSVSFKQHKMGQSQVHT